MSNPTAELCELLKELDVPVRIGLRAQGHIPAVKRMLAEGRTWDQIGAEIGWHPVAAREHYELDRLVQAAQAAESKRVRHELLEWSKANAWLGATGHILGASDFRAALDRICPEGAEP